MREMKEGTCQVCGDYGLTMGNTYKESYCGDCAPAELVSAYVDWWNSPASARYKAGAAKQALSELLSEDLPDLAEQRERRQLPKDQQRPDFPG